MKKYSNILIFLSISVIANSQPSYIKDIDELIQKGHAIKTKNIDSTLILAKEALYESQEFNYELGIIKGYTLAAFYYLNKYKYDTARFLLNKSIQYFANNPKQQNSVDHGQVFLQLGYIAFRELNLKLARTYAQNALSMFKQHGHTEATLSALVLLGGVESSEGNYAKGLAYYSNILRTKNDLNYPEERYISDYSNLAAMYIKIGQYEKAILYSKKALSLSEKYHYLDKQLTNLNNLGAAYSGLYKYDSSLLFYEKCVALSIKNDRIEQKDIALFNLSNLYFKQEQYEKSLKLVREVIALNPNREVLLNANILLANNYLHLGKTDSAITLAAQLYKKDYKYSRNKESTIELTNLISKAYRINKKYDSALYYLNIHQALSDSLYNHENQRKLNLLYAEMASLEKEKEIEILRQDSIIQKKKNDSQIIIFVSASLILIFMSISLVLIFRNKEKKEKLLSIELKQQLEKKRRDLHQQTLKIIYMNNSLIEVENNLKKIQMSSTEGQSKDIELILQTIRNNKTLDAEWENFVEYFDQVYNHFTQKVTSRFPSLSMSETRLILLIKMELKNREIASILNIDTASVKMAKYRLKKKLQLPEEIDIQQYLQNFN
ncbi:MAG: tetratricopeptide repeat protein [Cytophagia bacterium]|nr:tetratricopeptide repeat protein [Cytophagia bacterium]